MAGTRMFVAAPLQFDGDVPVDRAGRGDEQTADVYYPGALLAPRRHVSRMRAPDHLACAFIIHDAEAAFACLTLACFLITGWHSAAGAAPAARPSS